jgi:hypothetical protein
MRVKLHRRGTVHEEKYATIEQYLNEHIPNLGIEHQNDFDLGAQSFKVHIANNSYLLKVSEPFVEDHDIPQILQRFDQWSLAPLLGQDKRRIVVVGNEGVQFLPRP